MNAWHTQTAVTTGRGHLRRALPCQDRTFTLEENGVTAMALADGAGSTRFGQEGAEIATRTVCRLLCQDFDRLSAAETPQELRQALLGPIRQELLDRADELAVQWGELACTLLAVAVQGDRYLLLHTGDGVIGYQRNGRLRVASVPRNGPFCNTTTFVTGRDALVTTRVIRGSAADLEGFVLMSDGCEACLYGKQQQKLAPLVEKLLLRTELLHPRVSQEQLEQLLEQVIAQKTQDDCSLALLTRQGERFGCWDRMTQRQRAGVLGVTTENRNRRRRQIARYARTYGVRAQEDPFEDFFAEP